MVDGAHFNEKQPIYVNPLPKEYNVLTFWMVFQINGCHVLLAVRTTEEIKEHIRNPGFQATHEILVPFMKGSHWFCPTSLECPPRLPGEHMLHFTSQLASIFSRGFLRVVQWCTWCGEEHYRLLARALLLLGWCYCNQFEVWDQFKLCASSTRPWFVLEKENA